TGSDLVRAEFFFHQSGSLTTGVQLDDHPVANGLSMIRSDHWLRRWSGRCKNRGVSDCRKQRDVTSPLVNPAVPRCYCQGLTVLVLESPYCWSVAPRLMHRALALQCDRPTVHIGAQ